MVNSDGLNNSMFMRQTAHRTAAFLGFRSTKKPPLPGQNGSFGQGDPLPMFHHRPSTALLGFLGLPFDTFNH